MSEETLLTAARRVVRFFNIDEAHGGLMSTETVQAVQTLDKQVRLTVEREKRGTEISAGLNAASAQDEKAASS
jgi:hypothetical protein